MSCKASCSAVGSSTVSTRYGKSSLSARALTADALLTGENGPMTALDRVLGD